MEGLHGRLIGADLGPWGDWGPDIYGCVYGIHHVLGKVGEGNKYKDIGL